MEAFDGFSGLRNGLKQIAAERGDWAGIPMPLENERLIIEPSYPNAAELMAIGRKDDGGPTCDGAPMKVRNIFWSDKKRSDVIIFEQNGKVDWTIRPGIHHFGMDLQTLGCSEAWGIEQEHNAIQLLGTLVKHRQLKQYLLTGMFLEHSERSGIDYCFRRLRPTIAIRDRKGKAVILAALCQHPIGYYEQTWAGAMCPTDDVVAHLMLCRGDEHMMWKRSNQHAPWRPEAGL